MEGKLWTWRRSIIGCSGKWAWVMASRVDGCLTGRIRQVPRRIRRNGNENNRGDLMQRFRASDRGPLPCCFSVRHGHGKESILKMPPCSETLHIASKLMSFESRSVSKVHICSWPLIMVRILSREPVIRRFELRGSKLTARNREIGKNGRYLEFQAFS